MSNLRTTIDFSKVIGVEQPIDVARTERQMSGRLSGKVCVITGTGGSMGRAAAMTFAREGASVVGCDLNVDAAEATMAMVRKAGGTMTSSSMVV